MSHAKQASTKRKRSMKAVPALGAAGLSLALASGVAAAASGPAAEMLIGKNAAVSQEITLFEEEISDVSLATFYVFDNENAGTLRRGVKIAAGGCGGCGGGGCGGCSTEPIDYGAPSLSYANPPRYSTQPARIYAQAPKRRHVHVPK
jgi:hypothetical protein